MNMIGTIFRAVRVDLFSHEVIIQCAEKDSALVTWRFDGW